MNEIQGIDTIRGLVGNPPKRISVSYDTIKVAEGLRQVWNSKYMAFLPYCFPCKEPLVWHNPPGRDNVLFHCSKCRRKWTKDKAWVAKEEGR